MEQNEQEQGMSFSDLLNLLKKNLLLIFIFALTCTLGSLIIAKVFKEVNYSANSQLYFVDKGNENDYLNLLQSRSFLDKANEKMNTTHSYDYLLNSLNASFSKSSNILKIEVVAEDEEFCVAFANALAEVAFTEIPLITEKKQPKILQLAYPTNNKIGPNLFNYGIIGLLIGLILGFGVVLIIYISNNSFKNEEEVLHILGYDTLGVISDYKDIGNAFKETKKGKPELCKK